MEVEYKFALNIKIKHKTLRNSYCGKQLQAFCPKPPGLSPPCSATRKIHRYKDRAINPNRTHKWRLQVEDGEMACHQ